MHYCTITRPSVNRTGTCGPSARPRSLHITPLRPVLCPATTPDAQGTSSLIRDIQNAISSGLLKGAALACALSLTLQGGALASEDGPRVLRLPASSVPEVYSTQKTLMEAWGIVGESFVDDTFNGHDWPFELKQHMIAAYEAQNGPMAFQEIVAMLSDLGDPYTRVIPLSEYEDFRVSSDGELHGVGLLIANEPVNNHLLVLGSVRGGPADRAGIVSGDEVLSINGTSTDGWTGEMAAKLLRGQKGTEVRVKFARRTDGIPGVPGRPEPPLEVQTKEVNMRRERVNLSPLYSTVLEAGPGAKVGYIRLSSFTQNAGQDMHDALVHMERQGCNGYVLDLRDNPGGLVHAGMDVARLWMDGHPPLFTVAGRDGEPLRSVILENRGQSITHDPLVVLVNEHSASASEILSGALHDNQRAVIVGDRNTYGKGKIQSVYELQDGSALFVTVAKYQTPNGTPIDTIGLKPDRSCNPQGLLGTAPPGGPAARGSGGMLLQASAGTNNINTSSTSSRSGGRTQFGVMRPEDVMEQLVSDRCLMTAVDVLKQGAGGVNKGGAPLSGPEAERGRLIASGIKVQKAPSLRSAPLLTEGPALS